MKKAKAAEMPPVDLAGAHPAEMAEADRLYRQERGMRLAANAHDHFLAEQDRKEGY